MLNERVFEFVTPRSSLAAVQAGGLDSLRDLPDVPVLSETLLRMELIVRERVIDLSEISHLVLSDLGAALQVMRLAGRDDAFEDERVPRIEDCISNLGVQACVEAISRRPLTRSMRPAAVVEAWTHARVIAENCKFLAEEGVSAVHPDEAYLVGLFHDLGSLPSILGWKRSLGVPADPVLAGLKLAQGWSFPECVVEYFSELRSHAHALQWVDIVEQAHPDAKFSLPAMPMDAAVSMQLA